MSKFKSVVQKKEEWARVVRAAERFERRHQKAERSKEPDVPAITVAPRPPLIYGYTRCSHPDSRESGLGLGEQVDRINAYTGLIKLDLPPDVGSGPILSDEAVSAWKVPFRKRPNASKLLAECRPGDHIVFADFSRAFRNVRDCHNTLSWFRDQGIQAHFADLRVDINSPSGELLLSVMAAVTQWFARDISERNKAIKERQRRLGRPLGGIPPWGVKRAGPKGARRDEWDYRTRWIFSKIIEIRDSEPQPTWPEVVDRLEAILAEREKRRVKRRCESREWGLTKCHDGYVREKIIREVEAEFIAEGVGNKPGKPLPSLMAEVQRRAKSARVAYQRQKKRGEVDTTDHPSSDPE